MKRKIQAAEISDTESEMESLDSDDEVYFNFLNISVKLLNFIFLKPQKTLTIDIPSG